MRRTGFCTRYAIHTHRYPGFLLFTDTKADRKPLQCATVNFVSGSGTQTSDCNNGSAVTAAFSSDASLSALVQSDHSTTNGTSTASSSSSSSSSKSMAPGLAPSVGGLVGSMAVVVVASFFGAGLLL